MHVDFVKMLIDGLFFYSIPGYLCDAFLDTLLVLLFVKVIVGKSLPFQYESFSQDDFNQIIPNPYLSRFFHFIYHLQLDAKGRYSLYAGYVLGFSEMLGKIKLKWMTAFVMPAVVNFLGGWLLIAAVVVLSISILARIISFIYLDARIAIYKSLDPRVSDSKKVHKLPHHSLDLFLDMESYDKDYCIIVDQLRALGKAVNSQLPYDHPLQPVVQQLSQYGYTSLDLRLRSPSTSSHPSSDSDLDSGDVEVMNLSERSLFRPQGLGSDRYLESQTSASLNGSQSTHIHDVVLATLEHLMAMAQAPDSEVSSQEIQHYYAQYQSDHAVLNASPIVEQSILNTDSSPLMYVFQARKLSRLLAGYEFLFKAINAIGVIPQAHYPHLMPRALSGKLVEDRHVDHVKQDLDFLDKHLLKGYRPKDIRSNNQLFSYLEKSLDVLNRYYEHKKSIHVNLYQKIKCKRSMIARLDQERNHNGNPQPKGAQQLRLESEVKALRKELALPSYHACLMRNLEFINDKGIRPRAFFRALSHKINLFEQNYHEMTLSDQIIACWSVSEKYLNNLDRPRAESPGHDECLRRSPSQLSDVSFAY